MKYDFKSMLRIFVPLWITFLVFALLSRLSPGFPINSGVGFPSLLSSIYYFVYALLLITVNIAGVILAAQRFYAGLLKDEGYLMFTLPVKPWQLVGAKGINAAAIVVVNALLGILSLLVTRDTEMFQVLARGFHNFYNEVQKIDAGVSAFGLTAMVAVFFLIKAIDTIFTIYAAAALGNLAPRYKIAWSFGVFIGITVVFSVLMEPYEALVSVKDGSLLKAAFSSVPGFALSYLQAIFYAAIKIAACFAITERVFSKKPNLE